jgi:hypothetical protein
MANTLPDLQLLSNIAIDGLDPKAPLINAFTYDLSDQVADAGTAIQTYYVAAQTSSIWDSTNGFAPADKTLTKVTVTLQEPLFNTFYQSPNQAAAFTPEQVAGVIRPMLVGIVKEIENQIFRVAYTATNAPGVYYSASAASFKFSDLESAASKLYVSGSSNPCVAILNSPFHFGLRKDLSTLYGASSQVITGDPFSPQGQKVGVTTVFPYYELPKISAGLGGIVGFRDTVVVATRIPPVGVNVERAVVTHEQSGLTFAIDRWYDPTRGMFITAPKLSYGVVAGRTAFSARLLDTDNP